MFHQRLANISLCICRGMSEFLNSPLNVTPTSLIHRSDLLNLLYSLVFSHKSNQPHTFLQSLGWKTYNSPLHGSFFFFFNIFMVSWRMPTNTLYCEPAYKSRLVFQFSQKRLNFHNCIIPNFILAVMSWAYHYFYMNV